MKKRINVVCDYAKWYTYQFRSKEWMVLHSLLDWWTIIELILF
ncbi:MAG: hypothetical protein ACRCUJ_06515 [Phocaeicola sp.]